MHINVAGAGAGKTSRMADLVTDFTIPEGKVVFCIAFTNAAVENIRNKVASKLGEIPINIKISTIHSFLYQELISPYYYFLYRQHFEKLSVIDLPDNDAYKRTKLSELEDNNILHFTKIPEKAKWIADKKSTDRKTDKDIRKKILERFSEYCAVIFVDEAQDINKDMKNILCALEKAGIAIILYGDPKQDVKGLNQFKALIDETGDITYIPDCYRCPQIHLNISNTLACDSEKQTASEHNKSGEIEVIFETDIENVEDFIANGGYGLSYISEKRDGFVTHRDFKKGEQFETLRYEVHRAMEEKWKNIKSEIEINRAAFYITEKMIESYSGNNESSIIAKWVLNGAFDRLAGKRYAQMASAFKCNNNPESSAIVVRSIEIVKGLEAERCLFILTADLAPYLLQEKTDDNKMKHLLYVALTRSSDSLTILITRNVEEKYGRQRILKIVNNERSQEPTS